MGLRPLSLGGSSIAMLEADVIVPALAGSELSDASAVSVTGSKLTESLLLETSGAGVYEPPARGYRWHLIVRGRKPHELLGRVTFGPGWRVDVDRVSLL